MAEAFRQASLGLAEVLGARVAGGEARTVREVVASGAEPGALLVDLLNELVRLHEAEEVGFVDVRVAVPAGDSVRASVEVAPFMGEPDGTSVKAATYHQLRVEQRPSGWTEVRVFLDV